MALILLTIGPPLLILFYIIKSDRFMEPASAIIKVFLLGVSLLFPAIWLNGIFITDETAYLAGLTEESLKSTSLVSGCAITFSYSDPKRIALYISGSFSGFK